LGERGERVLRGRESIKTSLPCPNNSDVAGEGKVAGKNKENLGDHNSIHCANGKIWIHTGDREKVKTKMLYKDGAKPLPSSKKTEPRAG